MNKRYLSILVVALLAFSVFVIMNADDLDATVDSGIWINGEYEMTGDYDAHWADQGWKFEGNHHGGTLYFNNATFTQCCEATYGPNSPIFYAPDLVGCGLTIVLQGDNYIEVTTTDSVKDKWAGIYSVDGVSLTGDGTLTITITDNHDKLTYGIYAGGGVSTDGPTCNITVPDGGSFTPGDYDDFNCDIWCHSLGVSGGAFHASRFIFCYYYDAAISAGEISFSGKRSDIADNIWCDDPSDGNFNLSGTGLVSFNYNVATDASLIHAEVAIYADDALMSDNIGIEEHDVRATSAGTGWIGFKSSTISFDGNGGTPSTASSVTSTVGKLSELPSATYDGYIFQGWFTETEGGTEVTTSTVFKSDSTVYAQWVDGPNIKTITFDANGGTCTTTTMKTGADKKLATLPDATKDGYTFDGWYTAAEGGDKITTSTQFDANTTVYAHWTASGGGGGSETGGSSIDFGRLIDRDLRLTILLTAVTVLSLFIMCSHIFGKKE